MPALLAAWAGPAAADMVTVTDIAGRSVAVDVPVERVILGEGRQLYLAAALDAEDPLGRIVAWRNDLIEADPATYAQYLAAFPELADLPSFAGHEDSLIDIETAIIQKPDVVILNIEAMRATEDAQYIEKLGALGIPLVYIDFRHYPLTNTDPTIRLMGTLFGQEERAEALIAFRNAEIARVTDVIAAADPVRPRVFIERIGGYSDDCCLSFGPENFGRFVELAGGTNIGSAFIPETFGQLSPEQVLVSDPEHVVVTSADWEAYVPGGRWIPLGPGADMEEAARKLAWFPERPAYFDISANRAGRFHGIWHQFYNSPYQFVAIQALAKWFHPELFADLDPNATFRTLHERFLPIPYEPGYWISLDAAD